MFAKTGNWCKINGKMVHLLMKKSKSKSANNFFLNNQTNIIMVKLQLMILHVLGARAFPIFKKICSILSIFCPDLECQEGKNNNFLNKGGKILVINVCNKIFLNIFVRARAVPVYPSKSVIANFCHPVQLSVASQPSKVSQASSQA